MGYFLRTPAKRSAVSASYYGYGSDSREILGGTSLQYCQRKHCNQSGTSLDNAPDSESQEAQHDDLDAVMPGVYHPALVAFTPSTVQLTGDIATVGPDHTGETKGPMQATTWLFLLTLSRLITQRVIATGYLLCQGVICCESPSSVSKFASADRRATDWVYSPVVLISMD